jgi:hypothetical protein
MRCKSLDTVVRSELRSLNSGLLRLLIWPGYAEGARSLGLAPEIIAQLRALTADDLEFIAGTPALLAGFEMSATVNAAGQVAEPGSRRHLRSLDAMSCDTFEPIDPWSQAAHLFTATLLTWLWKTDSRDQLVMALCMGPDHPLPRLGVSRIEALAAHARQRLRVRFGNKPRFWPDLIRAARSRDTDLRELSRLAVLPLMLAEEHPD